MHAWHGLRWLIRDDVSQEASFSCCGLRFWRESALVVLTSPAEDSEIAAGRGSHKIVILPSDSLDLRAAFVQVGLPPGLYVCMRVCVCVCVCVCELVRVCGCLCCLHLQTTHAYTGKSALGASSHGFGGRLPHAAGCHVCPGRLSSEVQDP